jgi:hydroxyacylglutathione hydrolase
LKPIDAKAFKTVWEATHALVIDTRPKEIFSWQFIPGSVFIGVDDSLAPWVGTLVPDLNQPILIVAEPGKEEEVITRLARVGYDNVQGYLKRGISAWVAAGYETDTMLEIEADDFALEFRGHSTINLLDVRRQSEFRSEHILGAENFPLDFIESNMGRLNRSKTYYLHCAGGYRSLIAASILKSNGFHHVVNIKGGYNALHKTRLQHTAHVEMNTEL